MLTKVQNPKHYAVPYNKEVAKKDVISIIDDEGFLREVSFSDLTDHPTTISGYGITDAYISNGTIYLGNESITPASVSSLGTAAYKDYTTSVTQGGADLPTSDAVFQAIGAAVSSALHYRGISSTVITDGGTETAVIGGQPLVAQSGDVVIYSGFEFLWENNVWNKLGDDTSFALKTVQITGDGIYITGGGDLTTSRSLGLSQAAIDALALASTAVQPSALDAYLPLAGNSVATKITGSVILGNAKYLQGVKNDGTSAVNLLGINSSNNIHVGNTGCNLYLDSGSADIYHYKAGTSYRIYDADNLTLRTLAGSSAIGSSTQPVYYNGSSLTTCDLSTTYAPYNANGYLPLSGGTMLNTNLVTNMNADLLDGLHSYEQMRLGKAKDTLGTNSIAYGLNAEATGDYAFALSYSALASNAYSGAIGYGAKASGQYAYAFGYNAKAEANRAYALGHGNNALTDYSIAFGGVGNYAGLLSGDSAKPYIKLAEYTPKAITYGGSTVYGIWNKYNNATSVTFTYGGASYTVNWPAASPGYWRAMVVVEVTGNIKVPVTTAPFERFYIKCGIGKSIGGNTIQQVTSLGNDLYAIISSTCSTADTWIDDRELGSTTRVGLWTLSTTSAGSSAIAIGNNTRASGSGAVSLGYQNIASGDYSYALGYQVFASGVYSFAFGYQSIATGSYAVTLGVKSAANAAYSLSTGLESIASGPYSLATGAYSVASNAYAVAIGEYSKSMHNGSKVLASYGTSGTASQTVLGKYNAVTGDALIVGWGTADNARANIMTLSTAGVLKVPNVEASELVIPTSAPTNPVSGKCYLYYDTTNHKICVREGDGTVYSIQLST